MNALLFLAAVGALAQQPLQVRRGDLKVVVRVRGTVVAADTVRLKSSIEGRVEDLTASTYTWVVNGAPLGYLANREMAAILDSRTTTETDVVKERWRQVYAPTPIRCPYDCFVLRRFVKNKEWIKPKALLFETSRLHLVGRVRPQEAHWIRDGQLLEFWAVDDPARKLTATIQRYTLDIQGEKVEPGGSFTVTLGPKNSLDPGTEWEGLIQPLTKKNVLIVPTDAVIRYAGASYLAVRVSTGITTDSFTEVTAGVEDKRPILVLDDARLKEAMRHHLEADPEAVRRRVQEEYLRDNPDARRRPRQDIQGAVRDPDDLRYSEDPYAE